MRGGANAKFGVDQCTAMFHNAQPEPRGVAFGSRGHALSVVPNRQESSFSGNSDTDLDVVRIGMLDGAIYVTRGRNET